MKHMDVQGCVLRQCLSTYVDASISYTVCICHGNLAKILIYWPPSNEINSCSFNCILMIKMILLKYCNNTSRMKCRIYVVKSPLIGAPKYFPKLHHSVVLQVRQPTDYVSLQLFDVVPENPTSPETLISMIMGNAVPAIPRCRQVSKINVTESDLVACVVGNQCDSVVEAARTFQIDYFSGPDGARMGLYRNNCVHFCSTLVEHLLDEFPTVAE